MTKLEKAKDVLHNTIWWAGIVGKVLMFQAALILMILGVFYVLNFRVQIVPIVQTVSPVIEEAL